MYGSGYGGVFVLVVVPECAQCPIVFLLESLRNAMLQMFDYVLGRSIHYVFVVLVGMVSVRMCVPCVFQKFFASGAEERMVGDPRRDRGKWEIGFGDGLKDSGHWDVI